MKERWIGWQHHQFSIGSVVLKDMKQVVHGIITEIANMHQYLNGYLKNNDQTLKKSWKNQSKFKLKHLKAMKNGWKVKRILNGKCKSEEWRLFSLLQSMNTENLTTNLKNWGETLKGSLIQSQNKRMSSIVSKCLMELLRIKSTNW